MKIIGVMSGTSHDGVDIALAEITDGTDKLFFREELPCKKQICRDYDGVKVKFLGHHHRRYPASLRKEIARAFSGDTERICRLHYTLGEFYASCIIDFLKGEDISTQDVVALAVHGQTVYHIPRKGGRRGASLQIGNPAVIAERTGILTISDFRSRDIAAGGEGAPLVPVSDYILFRKR
ncbi:MAG: anhydro-N-acetylmuramic acid kinase, partial [Nitrospirae bacterium]